MVLKLYGDMASPCVRAVVFTAKILNVPYEFIDVDIFKQKQYAPDFLKINPVHTVPALDDDGFKVWDSHAIMVYIAEKYGKGHSLYPEDVQKRAIINQMLHFENGKIFAMHRYAGLSLLRGEVKEVPKFAADELKNGHKHLNTFLENTKYIAGNEMTIADLSIWTTLTNSQIYLPVDAKENPRLAKYLKLMDELPYAKMNQDGKIILKQILDKALNVK